MVRQMIIKEKLIKDLSFSKDYIIKNIKIKEIDVKIIYNLTVTNAINITNYILRPLQSFTKKQLFRLEKSLLIDEVNILSENEIIDYINQGYVIIITNKIYAIPAPKDLSRGITTIESELSLTGPKR